MASRNLEQLHICYSNGFLEGINNTSKFIKRNAYNFRKYEHFKAEILFSRVYKNIGSHLG